MADIWKKLNLKEQPQVVVLDAPESFANACELLDDERLCRELKGVKQIEFLLAFVTKQTQINSVCRRIKNKLEGDATVWIAYPKGSSKNYQCDFNRDSGWEPVGEIGMEGVRQVAIDDDWSALRFRCVEYIKKMTRDPKRALSKKGKKRT